MRPGGLVLTNSTGLASCDPDIRPPCWTRKFTPTIGYTERPGVTSVQGYRWPAEYVQIKQGNNQTGTPGERLPLALLVHVTDSGGNTVTGSSHLASSHRRAVTLSNIVAPPTATAMLLPWQL